MGINSCSFFLTLHYDPLKIIMCMVFFLHVSVHHLHAWYQPKSEGVGSPETGVTDGHEPPCRC